MANTELTRRALFGVAAASVGSLMIVADPAAAGTPVATFALDPTTGGKCAPNCTSCSACIDHAANKLFKSSAAADAGRAHPGCNCAIIAGQSLSAGVLAKIFAAADAADRRTPAIAALLSAEVEQHSVPMVSGLVPVTVLGAGACGILWIAHRRRDLAAR